MTVAICAWYIGGTIVTYVTVTAKVAQPAWSDCLFRTADILTAAYPRVIFRLRKPKGERAAVISDCLVAPQK